MPDIIQIIKENDWLFIGCIIVVSFFLFAALGVGLMLLQDYMVRKRDERKPPKHTIGTHGNIVHHSDGIPEDIYN